MTSADLQDLLQQTPRVARGVDVTALTLDAHEGFVLSCIDGQTNAAQLSDLTGLTHPDLLDILHRLMLLHAIDWDDPTGGNGDQRDAAGETTDSEAETATPEPIPVPIPIPVPTSAGPAARPATVQPNPAHAASEPDHGEPPVDPEQHPSLDEPGDLPRSDRIKILRAEQQARATDYWGLLGVDGAADVQTIKRAFLRASKTFHPDRYFGKQLGSYRDRLARIFHTLKRAQDVLSHEDQKRAYMQQHPPPAVAAVTAPAAASSTSTTSTAPAAAARAAAPPSAGGAPRARPAGSSLRRAALEKSLSRVKAHVQSGESGSSAASASTTPARRPDPADPERERRLEERRHAIEERRKVNPMRGNPGTAGAAPRASMSPEVASGKARHMYEVGLSEAQKGHHVEAVASFKLALSYAPGHRDYEEAYKKSAGLADGTRARTLVERAESLASTGNAGGAAKLFAEAADLMPTEPRYAVRAGQEHLQAGEKEKALGFVRRALDLAPERKEVRVLAANVLEMIGDKSGAIEHLNVAARLDAKDPAISKALLRLSKAKK